MSPCHSKSSRKDTKIKRVPSPDVEVRPTVIPGLISFLVDVMLRFWMLIEDDGIIHATLT